MQADDKVEIQTLPGIISFLKLKNTTEELLELFSVWWKLTL